MRVRAKLAILLVSALLVWGAGASPGLPEVRGAEQDPAGHHAHEGDPPESGKPQAVKVEIILRDGAYRVIKGGQANQTGFSLVAGADAVISLRNEDGIAHDFVSPLFTRTDIHFSGQAIGIFRKEAAGFRLPPGQALTLRFKAPFSDFRTFYDLIWCSQHEDHQLKGRELLIVVTKETALRAEPGSAGTHDKH